MEKPEALQQSSVTPTQHGAGTGVITAMGVWMLGAIVIVQAVLLPLYYAIVSVFVIGMMAGVVVGMRAGINYYHRQNTAQPVVLPAALPSGEENEMA